MAGKIKWNFCQDCDRMGVSKLASIIDKGKKFCKEHWQIYQNWKGKQKKSQ